MDMLAWTGEAAFVDGLVEAGLISTDEKRHVLRIMSKYTGKCAGQPGSGGGGILKGSPDLLQQPSLKDIVEGAFRKAGYDHLMKLGIDELPRKGRGELMNAPDEVVKALRRIAVAAGVPPDKHQWLLSDMRTFFDTISKLSIPTNLRPTLTVNGTENRLDTLRMRMAIARAKSEQHIYVGFSPDSFKTFAPIWLLEEMEAERKQGDLPPGRLLYLLPSMTLELANRIVPGIVQGSAAESYYLSNPPDVGVIQSGITAEKLEEEMTKRIVFCPYSMLPQKKNGVKIFERLMECEHPFSILAADEAPMAGGGKEWTQALHSLILGIPDLYKQGNILLMSGTPGQGRLWRLRNQMELLESPPEDWDGSGSEKRVANNPKELRRRMARRMVNPDNREAWQEDIDFAPYELTEREMALQRTVVRNTSFTHQEKYQLCMRAIHSPGLVGNDPTIPCSFEAWLKAKLEEDLQQHRAVLIVEHHQRKGMLEGKKGEEDEASLLANRVKAISEACGTPAMPVHFHVIHGGIKEGRKRDAIYKDVEKAAKNQHKAVLLGHSGCLKLGKHFPSVDSIICCDPPWALDDVYQVLKRVRRRGKDARGVAFSASGTVQEGTLLHATHEQSALDECLYGSGSATDADMQRMLAEDEELNSDDIAAYLDSPEQHEARLGRWLHNAGAHGCREFWEQNVGDFRRRLAEAPVTASGDPDRCLAALIADLEKRKLLTPGNYLYTDSQGGSIDRMLREAQPNDARKPIWMDPVRSMLDDGRNRLALGESQPGAIEGTPVDLIGLIRAGKMERESQDAVILRGLEQMHMHVPEDGELHFTERVDSIIGAVRALKLGGSLIIPIPREACTKKEFEAFIREALPCFGLSVKTSLSGEVQSTDNEHDGPSRMFVAIAIKNNDGSIPVGDQEHRDQLVRVLEPSSLKFTHMAFWSDDDKRERSRLENERRQRQLPHALMHNEFKTGMRHFGSELGTAARALQITQLRALQTEVSYIRSLASGPEEFKDKIVSLKSEFAERGIEYMPYMSLRNQIACRLTSYPEDLFFPYDSQWNAPAQ
jgi:hypothetical protein